MFTLHRLHSKLSRRKGRQGSTGGLSDNTPRAAQRNTELYPHPAFCCADWLGLQQFQVHAQQRQNAGQITRGRDKRPTFHEIWGFEKYQSLQTSPVELRWESLLKGLTLSCFPKQGTRGDEWMCFCIRHRNLRAYREERAPESSAVRLFNATCLHQPGTQGACGERSHRGAEQEKGPHSRFPRSTTVLPNPWDMVPAVPWSCCPTVPSHPYVKR